MLLLAGFCLAQEAPKSEPGLFDAKVVRLPDFKLAAQAGSAQDALQAYLAGHTKQRAGDAAGALQDYLRFESMAAKQHLPARYRRHVTERLTRLRKYFSEEFEAARDLYARNRKAGLERLARLQKMAAGLPEETGAGAVIQTDALEAVLRTTQGRKEDVARKALLSAIEQNPLALYRYKAMKALKEMGGPDLLKREEEEKAAAAKKVAEDAVEDEDEGETTMEEGPPDDD